MVSETYFSRRLTDEDHVIHLIWNFHAIYHVCVVFPEKNDLIDYTAVTRGQPCKRRIPYIPATSLEAIMQNSLPVASVQKLDWNEGAIPPPPSVRSSLVAFIQAAEGNQLKWYPHLSGGAELLSGLASYCHVIPENIIVTNGSDDALILICYALLGPGKVAVAPSPTYEVRFSSYFSVTFFLSTFA